MSVRAPSDEVDVVASSCQTGAVALQSFSAMESSGDADVVGSSCQTGGTAAQSLLGRSPNDDV